MISLFFFERLVSRWLVTINFGNQHPLDFGSFFSPWVNESVMGLIHKINRFQFCLFAFFSIYLSLSLFLCQAFIVLWGFDLVSWDPREVFEAPDPSVNTVFVRYGDLIERRPMSLLKGMH